MSLPRPSPQYDENNEAITRAQIDAMDAQNMKKTQDVILRNRRLVLPSPNGSLWEIKVSNAGVVSTVAL